MNPYDWKTLPERIKNGQTPIAVVGLGYVGMPLAVAFSEKARVIGFDTNEEKIRLYRSGIDPTKEIGNEAYAAARCVLPPMKGSCGRPGSTLWPCLRR